MPDKLPSRRTILIVEDDQELRDMLKLALSLEGANVVTAANGAAALEAALAHRPDLIVLDLMMPVMSGEDFRRAQLANSAIAHIPVVVVSAHPQIATIAERIAAAGYCPKPLDIDQFWPYVRERLIA
jgi:CheY-like chemotaxis protein